MFFLALLLLLNFRLCRVKSAPPQDDLEHSSPLLARTKHLARAAASLPPPSPFHHDGVSTIFLAIIALGIYLLVGLLSFSLLDIELEGSATSSLVDALYFAIVTMTTVGYGDLVPRTAASKLFTCAFVFTGFGLVGVLVSGAANYLVEKQEMLLVQKIYLRHKRKEHKKQKEELAVEDEKHVVAAHWKMFIAGCAVVVHFIAGILALMCWEGLNFIDAFYVVCVTVTTLGYGDRSFLTQAGRIFAIIWILSSTVCVAQFFLYLAESRTEERQRDIASWALHRPTTPSDLEAADMDGDGVVRSVLTSALNLILSNKTYLQLSCHEVMM